ncbi:hypothetical protein [Actinosynnema sp. NPDC020468]|uniref:hypothetical protein n=1 Tax=Actinosynnema sp. NPDC020468 TaxID=3154488 RepID=UPI0033DC3598
MRGMSPRSSVRGRGLGTYHLPPTRRSTSGADEDADFVIVESMTGAEAGGAPDGDEE